MRKYTYIIISVLVLLVVPVTNAWGIRYARLSATVTPAGTGTAYVNNAVGTADKSKTGQNGNVSFPIRAEANPGYHFVCWSTNNSTGGSFSTNASDNRNVYATSNTSSNPTTSNIYCIFAENVYEVTYSPGTGDGAAMSRSTGFTYNSDSNVLRTNTYTKTSTVSYNTCGGSSVASESKPQTFKQWRSSYGGPFADGANLKTLTAAHNSTVELTAEWNNYSVTLPEPHKNFDGAERVFLGWYTAATGGERKGGAGDTIELSDNITLYAHWQEYDFTVNIVTSGFEKGEKGVLTVTLAGSPAFKYTLPFDLATSSTITLKGLPGGAYTVAPKGWSWNYNASPKTLTKTVDSNSVSFDFSLTSKNSSTAHYENSKVHWQP